MKKLSFAILFVVCLTLLVFPKQTDLTVLSYWSPNDVWGQEFEKILEDYEKNSPNINTSHVYLPRDQLATRVLTQALTKSLPDIVFADNPYVPQWIQAEVFLDITDLVEKWDEWDDYYEGFQKAVTYDGRIYGLYFTTNNIALFYNKDIFDELGIKEAPKTWEELLITCEIIQKNKNKKNIYPIGFSAWNDEEAVWQFEPFLWSNGGSLLELDKPEAIEALELWTNLVKHQYAPRDVLNWSQNDVTHQFCNQNIAMLIVGPWQIPVIREAGINFEIAPIPIPSGASHAVVPMGGEVFGIASSIKKEKIETAWDFLTYLVSPEVMANFGLKGGRIPTRKSAEAIALSGEPLFKVFIDQAQYSVFRPLAGGYEKYSEISFITRTAIQQALTLSISPQEAFEEASVKIRNLFDSEEEYKQALLQAREAITFE